MILSIKQWFSDWATALFAPDYQVRKTASDTWYIANSDGVLVEGGFTTEKAAKDRIREFGP
jgi:hypothetical protein